MPDVVVVTETDDEPTEVADAVAEAVEDTDPHETADAVGESAAAVADAVGEAVSETVSAVVSANALQNSDTDSVILDRLNELFAKVTALEHPEPVVVEPEPEVEVDIEDDEIVPNRRHPWFRSFGEWRGNA